MATSPFITDSQADQKIQEALKNVTGISGIFGCVVVAANNAPADLKSVADFVCLGVDDHLVINQAIDYAYANGGGKVQLTQGLFNTSNEILVKTGIILCGVGHSTIIRLQDGVNFGAMGTPSYVVRNHSANDEISIRDVKIDGNRSNNSGQHTSVGFINALNSFAENLFVLGGNGAYSGVGILVNSGINVCVNKCIATNAGRHGIATTSNPFGFIISNNQSYDNTQQGIHTSTGRGVVSSNYCTGNSDGISGTNAVDTIYSNNVCIQNRVSGFTCNGGYKLINNNNLSDNGGNGIFLDYTGGGITNIVMQGNSIMSNGENGVKVTGGASLIISNNIIRNVKIGYNGVLFSDKMLEGPIFIRGNQITHINGATDKSIVFGSGYDNLQVVGNSFANGIEYDVSATNVIEKDNMAI